MNCTEKVGTTANSPFNGKKVRYLNSTKTIFPLKGLFAVASLVEGLKIRQNAHLFSKRFNLTMGLLPLKDFLPNEFKPEMNR